MACGPDSVLADGRRAGWHAARVLGRTKGEPPPAPPTRLQARSAIPWPIFPHPQGQDFVDFDEDLEVKDIRNAVLDGYDDVQLLKRYSTLGMGPSQGRHSNVAAIRLLAEATGRADRGGRHDHGAASLQRGEVRAPRRARLRPRAPHRRCTTGTWSSAPG